MGKIWIGIYWEKLKSSRATSPGWMWMRLSMLPIQPKLLEECRTIGGCPTGDARITGGYSLAARHVIHTVGPVYGGKPQDSQLLTGCYLNSLKLAAENNLATIAFPAISCGVYGYPIEDACKIAVDTSYAFLKTHASLKKIIFIQFSPKDYAVYAAYLKSISPS
jgi:O-acetyl-ADP-ribose deacetylase (regulator of RNase III)